VAESQREKVGVWGIKFNFLHISPLRAMNSGDFWLFQDSGVVLVALLASGGGVLPVLFVEWCSGNFLLFPACARARTISESITDVYCPYSSGSITL